VLGSPPEVQPHNFTCVDLNGDGRVDLATADNTNHNLHLFFQTPAGAFQDDPDQTLGGPSTTVRPSFVAAGDLDGDGRPDLVSANLTDPMVGEGSNLTIFLQDAEGRFPIVPSRTLGGPDVTNIPLFVGVADLDGDGRNDIVSTNASGGSLTVFFQESDGEFPAEPLVLGSGLTTYAVAADLDGDALLDLAAATVDGLALFFQTSPGVFPTAPDLLLEDPPRTDSTRYLAARDLNADGLIDLVAAGGTFESGLTVFLQTSPGRFPATPSLFLPDPAGDQPSSVVAADVNGDGQPDLVSAGFGRINVYLSE
jgi:hypothetical protein